MDFDALAELPDGQAEKVLFEMAMMKNKLTQFKKARIGTPSESASVATSFATASMVSPSSGAGSASSAAGGSSGAASSFGAGGPGGAGGAFLSAAHDEDDGADEDDNEDPDDLAPASRKKKIKVNKDQVAVDFKNMRKTPLVLQDAEDAKGEVFREISPSGQTHMSAKYARLMAGAPTKLNYDGEDRRGKKPSLFFDDKELYYMYRNRWMAICKAERLNKPYGLVAPAPPAPAAAPAPPASAAAVAPPAPVAAVSIYDITEDESSESSDGEMAPTAAVAPFSIDNEIKEWRNSSDLDAGWSSLDNLVEAMDEHYKETPPPMNVVDLVIVIARDIFPTYNCIGIVSKIFDISVFLSSSIGGKATEILRHMFDTMRQKKCQKVDIPYMDFGDAFNVDPFLMSACKNMFTDRHSALVAKLGIA